MYIHRQYANGWAAKQYKAAGGGWKTENKESVNEAKSMDMKKRLKVYDKLKKGDEITIKYGSSMSSGREGKFKVTKGKTVVGKQKVERITLQNVKNPKGVKFYLYQRNGNVTMAIGDMGATIEDMYESVNEGDVTKKINRRGDEDGLLVKHNGEEYHIVYSGDFDMGTSVQPYGIVMPGDDTVSFLGKDKKAKQIWKQLKPKVDKFFKTNEATPEEEDEFHRNLDKLVHKTFGHSSDEEKMNEASEPEIITQLRSIVSNKQNQKLKDPKSGKQMRVDLYSASAVTQVYDALKQQSNKDKFVGMGLVGMVNTAFKLINKNEINEAIEFSKQQLDTLRKNYSTINKINPSSPTYTKLIKFLNSLDNKALKQIANADVKFLSMLAKNRIKEGEEIEEYDVETLEELNDFHQFMKEYKSDINEGEYQGRDVELGKIMQGDVKKFKVYVKNDKGNVVKVNFGQKGMTIKKDNPGARKSFRARMNCDNPGPRWKARYWSCRKW
jgi:hypothetical protein